MAMSRSFGGTSLTTRSPMRTVPLRDRLEAGDHPQRGGLAAARRADEHHELAVGDVEVERADGFGAVGVDLPDVVENDVCHRSPRSAVIVGHFASARGRAVAVVERTTSSSGRRCSTATAGRSSPCERGEQERGAEAPALEQRLAHGGEAGVAEISMSSKPTTDRSLGHAQAAARAAASSTPVACTSDAAKIAVGRSPQGQQLLGEPRGRRRARAGRGARSARSKPDAGVARASAGSPARGTALDVKPNALSGESPMNAMPLGGRGRRGGGWRCGRPRRRR